mmetsp:Transcript_17644/g.50235  ORF Transcript_17644/g.50235 Transcript_17644/m.50235 type:complete len:541 (-) Transcript_17644:413-2035(-)
MNWQVGSAGSLTSDAYCVIRLGTSSMRTSTVEGTTSPEWPDTEPAAYFPVYHHDQELEIEVRDEGKGFLSTKFVSFLGRMKGQKVRNLVGSLSSGGRAEHRFVLDTSQVNSSMLQVNDPVNCGVASELDILVEWSNAVPAVEGERFSRLAASTSHVHADDMMMLELHAGVGFPEDLFEKGLRWRCSWEGHSDCPVTSQRGTPRTEKPNYDSLPVALRSNPALMDVITRLAERGDSVERIAPIVDFPPQVVLEFLKAKSQHERRVRARRQREHNCLAVQWHQTLPLPVPSWADARLVIELLAGDRVIGTLDTFLLEERLREGHSSAAHTAKLVSRAPPSGVGGLAAWFFPECGQPQGGGGRFQALSMDISVRHQHFRRGPYLGVVGSNLMRPAHSFGSSAQQPMSATSSFDLLAHQQQHEDVQLSTDVNMFSMRNELDPPVAMSLPRALFGERIEETQEEHEEDEDDMEAQRSHPLPVPKLRTELDAEEQDAENAAWAAAAAEPAPEHVAPVRGASAPKGATDPKGQPQPAARSRLKIAGA